MHARREEAARLFEEVVQALCEPQPDLVSCLRKGLRACQLVRWTDTESWFQGELNGYAMESHIPPYRRVAATLEWRTHGIRAAVRVAVSEPKDARDVPTYAWLRAPVCDLIGVEDAGFVTPTGEAETVRAAGELVDIFNVEVIPPSAIKHALGLISQRLFNVCSQASIALRFSERAQSVFETYREVVDEHLAALDIGSLRSAYEALESSTPDTWRLRGPILSKCSPRLGSTTPQHQ